MGENSINYVVCTYNSYKKLTWPQWGQSPDRRCLIPDDSESDPTLLSEKEKWEEKKLIPI